MYIERFDGTKKTVAVHRSMDSHAHTRMKEMVLPSTQQSLRRLRRGRARKRLQKGGTRKRRGGDGEGNDEILSNYLKERCEYILSPGKKTHIDTGTKEFVDLLLYVKQNIEKETHPSEEEEKKEEDESEEEEKKEEDESEEEEKKEEDESEEEEKKEEDESEKKEDDESEEEEKKEDDESEKEEKKEEDEEKKKEDEETQNPYSLTTFPQTDYQDNLPIAIDATSLRISNQSAELSTLPPSITHLVIQGRTIATDPTNKPLGGASGIYTNSLPCPDLVQNMAKFVHFLTDTPTLHERMSKDEYKPGLDKLLPLVNTLDNLELLALVDCQIADETDLKTHIVQNVPSSKARHPLTLVLLGVDAYNLGPKADYHQNDIIAKLQADGIVVHIIDDYASDLHRKASTMFPQPEHAYNALWCSTKPDICRIAMRGNPDAYKRYTTQPCVPPSAYLTPYQLARFNQYDYTPWDVSWTVLAGAVAYLGAKTVLRSLTKWIFPSLRLPKFALLCTGAAVAYSTIGHEKLADALGFAAGANIGWGVMLDTAAQALSAAGHIATGALLLIGIKVGMASDDDATTLGNDEDGNSRKHAESTVSADTRARFNVLRVSVIQLMQKGAYNYIRDPKTVHTLLKLSVVNKRLRRPHVLLSVVVWVLKVCALMGVGYGIYTMATNKTVQDGAHMLSKKLKTRAATAYAQLKTPVKFVHHVNETMYETVWQTLGFKRGELTGSDGPKSSAARPSSYLPPLRSSKADMLHPTHVCLDLVGRELWVVDREGGAIHTKENKEGDANTGTSSSKETPKASIILEKTTIKHKHTETVYYASIKMGEEKKTPITCNKEMYEYCERVYNTTILPMKRVQVIKYKPHLSALESRISMIINLFVLPIATAIEKLTERRMRTHKQHLSNITYETLHTQFPTPLLNQFQQVLKNVLGNNKVRGDTIPGQLYNVLFGYEQWNHLRLPKSVVRVLENLSRQAQRRPTLCAGFLLLLILSFTGVLPILLLVVSASLLATGDSLLALQPQLKHYLNPEQWKTTLRSLLRTVYDGNTRVYVDATKKENNGTPPPPKKNGGVGGEYLKDLVKGVQSQGVQLKDTLTKMSNTVKKSFQKIQKRMIDHSYDLSVDPTIIVSTGSEYTYTRCNNGDCIYITEQLERNSDIQTVDEYLHPNVPEARVLVKGLYYIAPDNKLYSFVSKTNPKVGDFRYLIHSYDLCKFTITDSGHMVGNHPERVIKTPMTTHDDASADYVLHCGEYVFCFRIQNTNTSVQKGDPIALGNTEYQFKMIFSVNGHSFQCHCTQAEAAEMNKIKKTDGDYVYRVTNTGDTQVIERSAYKFTINQTPSEKKQGGQPNSGSSLCFIQSASNAPWTLASFNTIWYYEGPTKLHIQPGIAPIPALCESTASSSYAKNDANTIWHARTLPKDPNIPNTVEHLIVGEHSDRFGREMDADMTDWETWLNTVFKADSKIQSLVLNIPIRYTEVSDALNRLAAQCVVHVRFLDADHFEDPWRGFCTARVKTLVIHYVPGLTEETVKGLRCLRTSLSSSHKESTDHVSTIDITQALCVSPQHAKDCRHNVDGHNDSDAACDWLMHALSQSKSLGSQIIHRPFEVFSQHKAVPTHLKVRLQALLKQTKPNLPPMQAVTKLAKAYHTKKHLYAPNELPTNLKDVGFAKIPNIQDDWKTSYNSYRPHIVVHNKRPYVYTPGQLLVIDETGKTDNRYSVSDTDPIYIDNAPVEPISIVGRPEEYAYTFKGTLPKTAYIVSFDAPLHRLQKLNIRTDVSSTKTYVVQRTTHLGNIREPIHLLMRTLVRCLMQRRWNQLLEPSTQTTKVVCFSFDRNATLRLLPMLTPTRLSLQKTPLFQHIVQTLKSVFDLLSNKIMVQKVLVEEQINKTVRRIMVRSLMPTGIRTLMKKLNESPTTVSNLWVTICQRMKKFFQAMTLRRKVVPPTVGSTHASGGTRKRRIHRLKHQRHRHRIPASTQRRRLAKRTRRQNHAAHSFTLRSA